MQGNGSLATPAQSTSNMFYGDSGSSGSGEVLCSSGGSGGGSDRQQHQQQHQHWRDPNYAQMGETTFVGETEASVRQVLNTS
jgi:hypothetical protein